MIDNKKYEKDLYSQGFKYIAGIDEVGRGPLVGDVVAACVVLPVGFDLPGLTDSKKLTAITRDKFYDIIMKQALAVGIGKVSPSRIDEINIYQATKEAMMIALNEAKKQIKIDYVLIDAMPLMLEEKSAPIIKGDLKSITIAAASVIAKVTRDRQMDELAKVYPMYGYEKHKGYPTKKHLEAINEYGINDYYRKSYNPVKKVMERRGIQ